MAMNLIRYPTMGAFACCFEYQWLPCLEDCAHQLHQTSLMGYQDTETNQERLPLTLDLDNPPSKQDIEVLLKIAAVLTAFSIGFSNADLNLIQSRHLKPNLTLLGFWFALRRKWTKNVEFICWRKSTKRIRLEGENGN